MTSYNLDSMEFELFDEEYSFYPDLDDDTFVTKACGPNQARHGRQLWQAGEVFVYDYTLDEINAVVTDGGRDYELAVWLDNEPDNINNDCDCSAARCRHTAAVLYEALRIVRELGPPASATPTTPVEPDRELLPKWQRDLPARLNSLTVVDLRQMAKRHQWNLRGTLKKEIIRQVTDYLIDAHGRDDWLQQLTADERLLLSAYYLLFGFPPTIVENQLQTAWELFLSPQKGKFSSQRLRPIMAGLQNYGLLYSCSEHGSDTHYHPLVPVAMAAMPVPALPRLPESTAEAGQNWSVVAAPSLLPLLLQLGHFAAAGGELLEVQAPWMKPSNKEMLKWVADWPVLPEEVKALQQKPPFMLYTGQQRLTLPFRDQILQPQSKKSLQGIVPDKDQLDWLATLLLAGGVLIQQPEQLVIQEAAWNEMLTLVPDEQWRRLFTVWQERFIDLMPLRLLLREEQALTVWRTVHPEYVFSYFLNDVLSAQAFLIRLLRALAQQEPADRWYDLNSFVTLIQKMRSDYLYSLSGENLWGFKRGTKQIKITHETDWLATYGRVLRSYITHSLHWLGLVDLARQNNAAVAFRITPTGRWLLLPQQNMPGGLLAASKVGPGSATWLDDRTIQIKPGSSVAGLLNLLARIGEPAGKPFTYRLSGSGLERLLAEGEKSDTLIRQFAEAGAPLPAATQAYLQELYGRYGLIHLYEKLTVIEFSDDMALAEVRAVSSSLQQALVYELSPRLVVINGLYTNTIMEELSKKGYTPRLTSQAGVPGAADNSREAEREAASAGQQGKR
jgi:hypothetical protein